MRSLTPVGAFAKRTTWRRRNCQCNKNTVTKNLSLDKKYLEACRAAVDRSSLLRGKERDDEGDRDMDGLEGYIDIELSEQAVALSNRCKPCRQQLCIVLVWSDLPDFLQQKKKKMSVKASRLNLQSRLSRGPLQ